LRYLTRQLTVQPHSRWQRVKQRAFDRLSRLIQRVYDPLVEQQVGGSMLALPFSHRLPLYLAWHPRYSTNLGRIARSIQNKYPDLTLIDVGANVGDTIALVRHEVPIPILCIEGDERFYEILLTNAARFENVEVVRAFVSDETDVLSVRSVQQGGTAHLERSTREDAVPLTRLDELLKKHRRFWDSKLIKIDTDGYDARVLRGAERQLSAVRPVIFFEFDPHFLKLQDEPPLDIFSWLSALGYRDLIIYDNFGDLLLDTQSTNRTHLEEITLYFTGRNAQQYCDIAAFHEEDRDLFDDVLQSELRFFRREKGTLTTS
jgi:FkbM family methyltransferase